MWKHMALSALVITLVVVSLLYCMSPGELETVYSVTSYRVSSQVSRLLAMGSDSWGKVVPEDRPAAPEVHPAGREPDSRHLNPDPFRPDERTNLPAHWRRLLSWMRDPFTIAACVTMAGLLCAGTYIRKRRCRFVSDGKGPTFWLERCGGWARRKADKPKREGQENESDGGLFHASGDSWNCVPDAAFDAQGGGAGAPPPLYGPPGKSARPFA